MKIDKIPEEDLLQLNQLMRKAEKAQYKVDLAFADKKNCDLEYENLLLRTYLKHELTSDYIVNNLTGEITLKKEEDENNTPEPQSD